MSLSPQWCSQDENIMWAQHEHIQCMHNMHLLGVLGYATAMKTFEIILSEIVTEAILWPLPVYLLHIHMKAIPHAINWSLTSAFYIIM